MEVHFSPEQEAQLAKIAANAGTHAERLVKDAALRLLQNNDRFYTAVLEGLQGLRASRSHSNRTRTGRSAKHFSASSDFRFCAAVRPD